MIEVRRRAAEHLAKLGDHAGASKRLALIPELCDPKDRAQAQLNLARELLASGDQDGARAAAKQAVADPTIGAEAAKFLEAPAVKLVD